MFKDWIFYMVIAWSELTGESQKTLILQFQYRTECLSIMEQVKLQLTPFKDKIFVKQAACYSCREFFENPKGRCQEPPRRAPPSPWTPKVKPSTKK